MWRIAPYSHGSKAINLNMVSGIETETAKDRPETWIFFKDANGRRFDSIGVNMGRGDAMVLVNRMLMHVKGLYRLDQSQLIE